LIAPTGRAAEPLSEEEYKYVRTCLDIVRNRSRDANGYLTLERRMLEMVVRGSLQGHGLKQNALADEIAAHLLETDQADHVSAYFHDGAELHVIESDEDASALSAFLQVMRRGGWFADFVAAQCKAMQAAFGVYPTPLEVMQALVPALDNFNRDVKSARDVAARYPHLFKPEPDATTSAKLPASENHKTAVAAAVPSTRSRTSQPES